MAAVDSCTRVTGMWKSTSLHPRKTGVPASDISLVIHGTTLATNALIERTGGGRHAVVATAHPSPLSARKGFFGSKPFSRINAALEKHGQSPIDWRL